MYGGYLPRNIRPQPVPVPPPVPGPLPLLREYHPCNPVMRNDRVYIQVNDNGEYNRNAPIRIAVPDPNKPGCYMLAPQQQQAPQQQGARRRKNKRKHKTRKHIGQRRRTHHKNRK